MLGMLVGCAWCLVLGGNMLRRMVVLGCLSKGVAETLLDSHEDESILARL